MKLSEAIRLGAMLRPQITCLYWNRWGGAKMGSCALGAAAEAIGLYPKMEGVSFNAVFLEMQKHWPWMNYAIRCSISAMNFNMSREKVADWVESIEPQEAQADAILPCAQETPERVRA